MNNSGYQDRGINWLWLVTVALAPVAVTFLTRGPFAIDETRYLAAAWDMWLRGDFLVPHLNGAIYSEKPPLLFWIFQAGWAVFGVNDWWPRLVSPLAALASLWLTARLGRRLWPADGAPLAPWILAATLLWVLCAPVVMFDVLLALLALVALNALMSVDQERPVRGWLLFGIAAGLGLLTKGPVMLLHVAFPALLAPLWSTAARRHPGRWYGGLGIALLLAAAIALLWVAAAGARAGPAYLDRIMWHQTAGRLVQSFAHSRPVWWYLAAAPVLLFPWSLWGPAWHGLAGLRSRRDTGVRFVLLWCLPTLLVFSLVSGKQPYYLLPLLPGAALLMARALALHRRPRELRARLPALVLLMLALVLVAIPGLATPYPVPDWLTGVQPAWGLAGIGCAVLLFRMRLPPGQIVPVLASGSVAALLVIQGPVMQAGANQFGVRATGQHLAALQARDAPIAHLGKYHGQYQFIGRLEHPLTVLGDDELPGWLAAHPDGYLVTYSKTRRTTGPEYIHPYRGKWVEVWHATDYATAMSSALGDKRAVGSSRIVPRHATPGR